MRYLCVIILCLTTGAVHADTWTIQVPDKPYDYAGPSTVQQYAPLARAAGPWKMCVAYPHLKDSYWLSVNHGMVEEARRLGVGFRLIEAGGYPNLERQRQQVRDCVDDGVDALIVGTVSFDGLTDTLQEISRQIPVIAAVNDIADEGITAKIGVSWTEMGFVAGRTIADFHPLGSTPVKVAWFPGPEGAGWVNFVEDGFRRAVQDSAVEIAVTKYGDTGREIQVLLVEEALEEVPDLDYIVGAAPAAEAAVSVLRSRGQEGRTKIVSDYMTHAVHRGIFRKKILFAPTDFPVLQGRMAIEFATRAIEGNLVHRHAGPVITPITSENIQLEQTGETLAPASFIPVFSLEPNQDR